MKTTRVRNPKALAHADFQELVTEALSHSSLYDAFPDEWLTSEDKVTIVCHDGEKFLGLLVVFLFQIPQVVMLFARTTKAKQALVKAGVDFARDNGYNRFWAINGTDAPDSVWKRAFWRKGKAKKIGTIMEFEV